VEEVAADDEPDGGDELELEGFPRDGIINGVSVMLVPFKIGKAAFGEGSGIDRYESAKISSWEPS
jgi:hypothetical protein